MNKRETIFRILQHLGIAKLCRLLKKGRVTILNLHRISNESDPFYEPLRPEKFERLLHYALQNYTIVSFAELSDADRHYSKPPLLLSFDDGYADFYEQAMPLLVKYGVPSNHNIVNECANTGAAIWTHRLNNIFTVSKDRSFDLRFTINNEKIALQDFKGNWQKFYLSVFKTLLQTPKTERIGYIKTMETSLSIDTSAAMMTWDQIEECSRNGVEIGSHTYSHDVITDSCDEHFLHHEILRSKEEIEMKLHLPVTILALPNGQGGQIIDNYAKNLGFRFLLYVNDAINQNLRPNPAFFHTLERINIVNESFSEMVLRTELFHSRLRRYV